MSGRSNPNRHGVVAVPVDPESPVVPLRALGRASLPVAGGKGANLGELVRAGFPVPPGFVITTAAYARFVAANGLAAVIARADAALREPGVAIRAAFEAAPIPADLAQDVLRAYATLGAGPVAVRSSATAEDLPTAAFAGQQFVADNRRFAFEHKPVRKRLQSRAFTRREISENEPLAGGWFINANFKPGDQVVVIGAQMLLSEEQKNQIQIGD